MRKPLTGLTIGILPSVLLSCVRRSSLPDKAHHLSHELFAGGIVLELCRPRWSREKRAGRRTPAFGVPVWPADATSSSTSKLCHIENRLKRCNFLLQALLELHDHVALGCSHAGNCPRPDVKTPLALFGEGRWFFVAALCESGKGTHQFRSGRPGAAEFRHVTHAAQAQIRSPASGCLFLATLPHPLLALDAEARFRSDARSRFNISLRETSVSNCSCLVLSSCRFPLETIFSLNQKACRRS